MSRTKQPWSCSHQRVRAGIAHGLWMLRLREGDYHASALIDDNDMTSSSNHPESCTPTLTNATPFAFWKNLYKGTTGKKSKF